MRSACPHGLKLSIVIPNARSFPQALVWQLQNECLDGDEIMVVQNLSALVSKNWTGIGRPAESNVMPKSMQASRTEFNLVTIHDSWLL